MAALRLYLAAAAAALLAVAAQAKTRAVLREDFRPAEGASAFQLTLQKLLVDATRTQSEDANPIEFLGEVLKHADVLAKNTYAMKSKMARMENRKRFSQVPPPGSNPVPDGYYRVVPQFMTGVPVGSPQTWQSACLLNNVATSVANGTTGVTLTIVSSQQNSSASGCQDFYLLATPDWLDVVAITQPGTLTFSVPVTSTTWVAREGVRVFRFLDDDWTTLDDLVTTLSLFIPSLLVPYDGPSVQRNRQFLQDYVNITMVERPNPGLVTPIDPSYFNSGDMLAIQRFDGLGTMEQWGTGEHTSHIAAFLRMGPNNDLYVVESTDTTSWWPTPDIQATLWEDWIPLGVNASYSIAHLPLNAAAQAAFNQTAAELYVQSTLGLPYGYHNFINTFFDTPDGNLPFPASWQFIEIAFNVLNGVVPSLINSIVEEACNMRLGTVNLTIVEIADTAAARNMTLGDLIALPEQDAWVYSDGPSMVCDVYFCSIQKHAGVFGALGQQIQCTEFQNFDAYSLAIFDLNRTLPLACQQADPGLPYCILMGNWTLELPGANSITPYANMRQHCSGLPLGYEHPPGC